MAISQQHNDEWMNMQRSSDGAPQATTRVPRPSPAALRARSYPQGYTDNGRRELMSIVDHKDMDDSLHQTSTRGSMTGQLHAMMDEVVEKVVPCWR